jgi:hypothetical protein
MKCRSCFWCETLADPTTGGISRNYGECANDYSEMCDHVVVLDDDDCDHFSPSYVEE